ncbi:hypothetical protein STAFG_2342 [Streptomyces afghaniensis 772]|uniref:Uncharacterized protein n=1 Tax=Streptomyces afghaniensis 772 TaxID=1283301 RepID=S4MV00_9ACTN|nr:hypothetical protein STAFG_2342 [Streptomyces afghaniensis 772]
MRRHLWDLEVATWRPDGRVLQTLREAGAGS